MLEAAADDPEVAASCQGNSAVGNYLEGIQSPGRTTRELPEPVELQMTRREPLSA